MMLAVCCLLVRYVREKRKWKIKKNEVEQKKGCSSSKITFLSDTYYIKVR